MREEKVTLFPLVWELKRKEEKTTKPVIIDPGLYSLRKSDVFWASEKRSVPTA